MITTKSVLTLPTIIKAADYHEFGMLEEYFKKMPFSKKLKVVELGFAGSLYIGMIYAGTKPNAAERAKLLADKKIELDN